MDIPRLELLVTIVGVIVAAVFGIVEWYDRRKSRQKDGLRIPPPSNEFREKEEKAITITNKISPLLVTYDSLTKEQIRKLTILTKGSYRLLQADRINGSWGKTIGKYMELTQDEGQWSEKDVFKYLLTGSLTHTYHALNGLCEYHRLTHQFFDPDIALSIVSYLSTWRLNYGAFATPVTNFDGSLGNPNIMNEHAADLFRQEIPQLMRHTACGILTIHRLLDLRDLSRNSSQLDKRGIHKWEGIVEILDKYNLAALRALSAYSGRIALDDPTIWGKVRYTPAYVCLAADEGIRRYSTYLSEEDQANLKRIRTCLIDFVFNDALQPGERFFCQYSNKKAFYYYSLLLLDTYMGIEEFSSDARAEAFCGKLLQALNDISTSIKGLSFGNANIPNKPWLNFCDIGVTARHLAVLSKYSALFEIDAEMKRAFVTGLLFIIDNMFDFENSTRNLLTHGWEAVLKLIPILDDPLKQKLTENIVDLTVTGNSELTNFVSSIAKRDFQGRETIDQQLRLFEVLSDDPHFSIIIQKFKRENTFNLLHDEQMLRKQIEINFSRETFMAFLNRNKIPYREDASLESMIDTTLFQFQFKKS